MEFSMVKMMKCTQNSEKNINVEFLKQKFHDRKNVRKGNRNKKKKQT